VSYLATRPDSQVYFQPAIDYFSGNGATSQFTLSRPVASVAQIIVSVANVIQNPNTFSVNNNILTLGGNAPVGTNNVWVQYQTAVIQVNQPGQGTVGTTQLMDQSVTAGKLTGVIGRLLRAPQLLTSGTSYTTPANCNNIYVECVGGGGGGGASNNTLGGIGGSGGGGGGFTAKFFSVSPSTSYSYAIGGGGGFQGTGGTTTFTVGGTTISAFGGAGGIGQYAGPAGNPGGGGGSSSGGDINLKGNGGEGVSFAVNYMSGAGGGGAGSLGGGGGPGVYYSGRIDGGEYGGGGAGGNGTAGPSGSLGGQGAIRIWEYA
jgi:hypothetical protein